MSEGFADGKIWQRIGKKTQNCFGSKYVSFSTPNDAPLKLCGTDLKSKNHPSYQKNMIDNEESFNWCLFFQVHRDLHYEFFYMRLARFLSFTVSNILFFCDIIDTQISLLLIIGRHSTTPVRFVIINVLELPLHNARLPSNTVISWCPDLDCMYFLPNIWQNVPCK